MTRFQVDDFVALKSDIPELALKAGVNGIVRARWFSPTIAYEVEFHLEGLDKEVRALLLPEQVGVPPILPIKTKVR